MLKSCSVCDHYERDAVEEALTQGAPYQELKSQFKVSIGSLRRHRRGHMANERSHDGGQLKRHDDTLEEAYSVLAEAILSWRALVDGAISRATGASSHIHGVEHWKRVAVAGLELRADVPEVDPLVVFLFALFHDSMRLNDFDDPEHGERGARA